MDCLEGRISPTETLFMEQHLIILFMKDSNRFSNDAALVRIFAIKGIFIENN